MDVDIDHKATATKDRTTLFADWRDTITEATGRLLKGWLESGAEPFSVADQAREACKAAGLTEVGLLQFCQMVSNGETSSLERLPRPILDRIIEGGISAETVAKCNGSAAEPDPDPEPDPAPEPQPDPEPEPGSDDLPAAWNI
jgi:hypothetical protein